MDRFLIVIAVSIAVACDATDTTYIERFVPFDGVSLAGADDAGGDGAAVNADGVVDNNLIPATLVSASENNAVDTSAAVCLVQDECSSEPFTAHFAWVTVRNDAVADDTVSVLETITGYTISYAFADPNVAADSPFALAPYQGRVRAVVGAGEAVTVQITLVPFERKSQIQVLLGDGPPITYVAQIRMTGENDLEMLASTTLLIGSFNNCGEDALLLDPVDALVFCSDDDGN